MMAIYDWCSGVCQEDIVKGITPCHTQTGEEISLTTIHHDDYLCKEFIISYKPFSLRRWLIWMVIFNILGYLLELHTQDSRIMTVILCIILVLLIIKLNIRVCQESLLISSTIGVQLTTRFLSGRTRSQFYDISEVQDIVINEGITLHQVIFYLTLLLQDAKTGSKLVPLYTHCWPSLSCLEQIYREVQRIVHKPS